MLLHFRRLLSIEGGGEGGAGSGGTPPVNGGGIPPANGGGTPPTNGGNVPPANGGGTPPVAFDWKAAQVDANDMALITERGWKDPKGVIESYRNLEKLTGVPADQIVKLPKSADAGEWNAVYDKMGRPKDATGYKIPLPEGDTGEFAKTVAPWFHEAGLSQAQADKLATKWNEHLGATQKTALEAKNLDVTKQVSELKTEWGAAYETNELLVNRAAAAFGMTAEQLNALKEVMGPKGAMKFMHNIGSKVAVEDAGLVTGDGPQGFKGMSPDTAAVEINRLRSTKDFAAQFNSKDPKVRMEAREKIDRLTKIAYPSM